MDIVDLPDHVRQKIWAIARRRHLTARLQALLEHKAAVQITSPEGVLLARLVISPRKLIHLSVRLTNQGVYEVVEAGEVTQRWRDDEGNHDWTLKIWDRRNLDCPEVEVLAAVAGFDYSRLDTWPAGHAKGWTDSMLLGQANVWKRRPLESWWDRFNDWLKEIGYETYEPQPTYDVTYDPRTASLTVAGPVV